MTAPVPASIRLPADDGNTGKRYATQQRTEGADQVHLQRTLVERSALVTGVYAAVSTLQSVSVAAQNATASAFLWMLMPAVSTEAARIRRLGLRHNIIGVTTLTTLPRIVLARANITGTPTGALLAGGRIKNAYEAQTLELRTAVTGLTVTLANNPGANLFGDIPPQAQVSGTPASFTVNPTTDQPLIPMSADEDEWPDIQPGEAMVLYQPDAGTASDTRRFVYSLMWDEIDIS